MEQQSGNRFWWVPWVLPLALVAVVVCAAVLPFWGFLLAAAVVLVVGVPFVGRLYAAAHPELRLPEWLPGGRPGNR
jgi:hypothetical protein